MNTTPNVFLMSEKQVVMCMYNKPSTLVINPIYQYHTYIVMYIMLTQSKDKRTKVKKDFIFLDFSLELTMKKETNIRCIIEK